MDSILRQLRSNELRESLPELWLVVWSAVLLAIAAWTARTHLKSGRGYRVDAGLMTAVRTRLAGVLTRARPFDWLAAGIMAVSLAAYVFLILYKQDLSTYDNDVLTDFVLNGRYYLPPIWPEYGRFFPLGHQEWNVLGLLTTNTVWFFLLPVVELLIVVTLVFRCLPKLPALAAAIVTLTLISTPSFVYSFFSLAISERNLILWILVFLLAARAYQQAPSALSGGIALLSTHVALYYKEPAFVLFAAFAALRLLHSLVVERPSSGRRIRLFVASHGLELGILTLCGIFLASYAVVYVQFQSLSYAANRGATDPRTALAYYLGFDVLLWLFLGVVLIRMTVLLFSRQAPDRVWDYLAIGAIGYFAFYVVMGMQSPHYLAPVDVVAILYICHVLSAAMLRSWTPVLIATICALVAVQNADTTRSIISRRLNLMDGKGQLTRFLLNYRRQQRGNEIRLHFPLTQRSYIYYFSCFVKYKDRLSRGRGSESAPGKMTFTSPLVFPNGRCVGWTRDHECLHAEAPQAGDLIMILPDDDASLETLGNFRNSGDLLFHYSSGRPDGQMDGYIFRLRSGGAVLQR